MATKEKKGAKFGRHARNPSSKLQSQRTERNKRLKKERHAKRMGKTVAQLERAGAFSVPDFPHVPLPREKERVRFDGPTQDYRKCHELHLYYTDGKLVEITPRRLPEHPVNTTGIATEHRVLNPVSGGLRLVDAKNWS